MRSKRETKSPLKAKPLRSPGQSLDDYLRDEVVDGVMTYFLAAIMFTVFAIIEWSRSVTGAQPMPWTFTIIAIPIVALATYKFVQARSSIQQLKLGRDGERAVGQYLERLREHGAQIFHDVLSDGFNLDHVVIHSSGIYVIETKTWSKPAKGEAKLLFDGESVQKGRLKPERNAITQARAARHWLTELLTESTGKRPPVRAVVVFPGWYIEPTAEARKSDTWVLNPKALPSFIGYSTEQLNESDVKLFAYHLDRYIRTYEPKNG